VVTKVGPWVLVDTGWKPTRRINQGLATVRSPGEGAPRLVFRGDDSVAPELRAKGWDHIGDPDSWGGIIFDAYQWADDTAKSKLFRVTNPDTTTLDFEHALVRDGSIEETYNNSFVAVSRDGQWLISGEWSEIDHFLVFPTPTINPAGPMSGEDLKLAGLLFLARPVRNVQGAVFLDETTLLCSTNDVNVVGRPPLWPVVRQLLRVTLTDPLPDMSRPATVECVGSLPYWRLGIGDPEVEGIDFDPVTGDLRVVVVPTFPLNLFVAAVYRFHRVDPN
jgi:hypothetical protein